ncbi:hypothetical protein ACNOYE_17430 [Nannocystaceae bacterium ST9]
MLSRPSSPEFSPERALPTLPWIAALALLVVNDHVLKGSGLLPGMLTGKLSDFAGLVVAPVLLATLVRARTRTSLLACHVAVGLVFAGIQLSLPFADLWSAAMGLLGHPWTITSDPSDLLALPMLLVSWRVLVPKMREEVAMLPELRRLAVGGLSLVGLWSSVATSYVDGGIDPDDQWYEDVYGNLIVNNANDHDIALLVRPLRPEIALDCSAVARDPGRLLPAQAFGEPVHWSLPPRTNVAIADSRWPCAAAWVAGEGIAPTILFWSSDEHPSAWFAGQIFVGESLPISATALVFDEQGASWVGGEGFRFAVDGSIPEQPESCQDLADERVDWDAALPKDRPLELLSLDYGPDGCFALELGDLWNPGSSTAYVCAPESALPFVAGEHLQFSEVGAGGVGRWLSVHRLDPATDTIALALDGEPELRVDLMRGVGTVETLGWQLGSHSVTAIPRPTCEWTVDDACATNERPFDLAVVGVEGTLAAGDPTVMLDDPIAGGDGVRRREFTLVHAQERSLLDPTCVEGAAGLGFDLDATIVSRPAL